jgi:hypothetical protein
MVDVYSRVTRALGNGTENKSVIGNNGVAHMWCELLLSCDMDDKRL